MNQQYGRNTKKQRQFNEQKGREKDNPSSSDKSWAITKWREETTRKFRQKGNKKGSKRTREQREWENVVEQTDTYDNNTITNHATSTKGSIRTGEIQGMRTKQTTLGERIGHHGGL